MAKDDAAGVRKLMASYSLTVMRIAQDVIKAPKLPHCDVYSLASSLSGQ
jgi:hypothetical protein